MDIEIITKIEGIIFKIFSDKDLKERWVKWTRYKTEFEPENDILQSTLWNLEKNKVNTTIRFLPRYQTIYFLDDVFVLSNIALANPSETIKIIDFYGKIYTKAILVSNKDGILVPETLLLIGNSSTGLLNNL